MDSVKTVYLPMAVFRTYRILTIFEIRLSRRWRSIWIQNRIIINGSRWVACGFGHRCGFLRLYFLAVKHKEESHELGDEKEIMESNKR